MCQAPQCLHLLSFYLIISQEDQSEAEVFKPLGAGESASQLQAEIVLNDGDSPPDFQQTSSGSSVHQTAVPVALNSESQCLQAAQVGIWNAPAPRIRFILAYLWQLTTELLWNSKNS